MMKITLNGNKFGNKMVNCEYNCKNPRITVINSIYCTTEAVVNYDNSTNSEF